MSLRVLKLHLEGSRTKRPKKSSKGQNKLLSQTAGEKRKETKYSGEHQLENQRQDPEREKGEGGYNENGGAEPYQERETLSILYLNAQSIYIIKKDIRIYYICTL